MYCKIGLWRENFQSTVTHTGQLLRDWFSMQNKRHSSQTLTGKRESLGKRGEEMSDRRDRVTTGRHVISASFRGGKQAIWMWSV